MCLAEMVCCGTKSFAILWLEYFAMASSSNFGNRILCELANTFLLVLKKLCIAVVPVFSRPICKNIFLKKNTLQISDH